MTCSQNCGFTTDDDNERFCPDDGAPLRNSGAAVVTSAEAPAVAPLPVMPALPDFGATIDTRTVIKTVVLPDANKTEIHLCEGDIKTIRRKRTDEEVADKGPDEPADYYLPADGDRAVSTSDPFALSIINGELVAKGGGVNGYKVTWMKSFVANQETVLKSVPEGQLVMTIVLGAKTPLRVK